MKKVLLLSLSLVLFNLSKAQNPYESLGIKNVKVLTLSNGKYNEFFNNETIVRIGSVILDTKTNKIVSFVDKDSIESETGFEPHLVSRWVSPDPLAEKYISWSPYNYVMNNPIIFIDPDGMQVKGVKKDDAQNFKQDIHNVLADDKFENLRALIDVKGKTFVTIEGDALTAALDGVELTKDEQAYVDMVTNTINSDDVHKIEYVSGDFTSTEGATAFKDHMNNAQPGVGDMMLTPEGNLSSGVIDRLGGLNVPTKNGSHSFISTKEYPAAGDERSVTSGHELFGHGIPSARGLSNAANNSNAIRADNLMRRIIGLPQRDGSNHSGYKEGQITSPYILPITN